MSRVKRLSIRGIRNFDDESDAKIIFSRPLTLIVGQNGVGKTTIIECLRYVTTGEFPPGSDRGKSFIHDPMLKRMTSVKIRGAVKAEFTARTGDRFTVTRTIEATRFEKNVKFKTLDSSITKIDPITKKEAMITHRCVDMDQETMNLLGVSKAILNNVIFCHQDDANWPLEDSKKLKERFDDIFDTVRYNKALELIRKQTKVRQADIRVINIEKRQLADKVAEVIAKETKLSEYSTRKSDVLLRIQDLEENLDPTTNRLDTIKEIESKYNQLTIDEEKKKTELHMATTQIRTLKAAIKEIFMGNDDNLEYEINSYDEILKVKNNKILQIEAALEELNIDEQKLSIKVSEHRVSLGTLNQQLKDQNRMIQLRDEILRSILLEWKLDSLDSSSPLAPSRVENFIKVIKSKIVEFQQSFKSKQAAQDQKESQLEKNLDLLRNERSKIICELKRNEQEAKEIDKTIRDTEMQIFQAGNASMRLDTVNKKIEEIEKLIKQMNEKNQLVNESAMMLKEMEKLEELEESYGKLDEEMAIMQTHSSLNIKLNSLKSELKKKQNEINKLKCKHEVNVLSLLGTNKLPEVNLKKSLEVIQNTLNKKLDNLQKDLSSEQYNAMTIETSLKHAKQDLNSKIAEIRCDAVKVMDHCPNYHSYDEYLFEQSKKVLHLQNKRGMFAHQKAAFTEYLTKLQEKDPCCPICERGFSTSSEVEKLSAKMSNDLQHYPEQLVNCEKELKVEQTKYDTLLSLKSTVEKIIKFETITKTELSDYIALQEMKLRQSSSKTNELKELTVKPSKQLEILKNIIPDMILWDKYSDEIMNIELSFDELEEELSQTGASQLTTRTIEQVQTERDNVRKMIKSIREKINTLRSNQEIKNEELRKANESRTKCLEEQLKIYAQVQKLQQLKKNSVELSEKKIFLEDSIQQSKKLLISSEKTMGSAMNELEIVKNENREEYEKNCKSMTEYSKQLDKLNSIHEEVIRFISKKIESKLNEVKIALVEIEKQVDEHRNDKVNKNKILIQIKEDISCQETKKRNLADNLKLREEQKNLDALKLAYKIIEKKIVALNYKEIINEKKVLEAQYEKNVREINIAKGTMEEVMNNITHLNQELMRKDYRDAKKIYNKKCIELAVTEMAVEDLATYGRALDLAMTEYHEERMNSVNKTMKKLWEFIYTGNDTSAIQIRTEASSGTEARRTFNYKLVQVKHGTEMDMRGRCSAGQRVLASIIMRLALAETFCDQCGILALDEPTTNLDEENAKSLAATLYKYVELRASHRNSFQLIIITHDENFIGKLSQLSNHNCAYELYRKSDSGLTGIRYLEMNPDGETQNLDADGDELDIGKNKSKNSRQDIYDSQNDRGSIRKKINTRPAAKKKPANFHTDF